MDSGTYTVDELVLGRTTDELAVCIKESILNGHTIIDNDCKINLRTVINNIDDHLIIELISRIDRTNPSYSKYMDEIDEVAGRAAVDMAEKLDMVF